MKTTVAVVVDNHLDNDVRVLKEINMLCDLGFDVRVLCFSFGSTVRYSRFEVERLPMSRKLKNLLFFLNVVLPFYEWYWVYHVRRFAKRHGADLVHTHDLYMSRPVAKAVRPLGIPMILDLHENYPVAYSTYSWTSRGIRKYIARPRAWFKKEGKYLNFADAFVFLSEAYAAKLYEKYPAIASKPRLVLPNIPDTSVFDKVADAAPHTEELRLLYFGAIAERRGLFELMEVLTPMLDRYPGIHLEIIGPVDKKDRAKFEGLLARMPGDNVTYIPWVELNRLPHHMSRADVGLAPFVKNEQHESGIANKIFQYMYGELALLVSDCKPQEELVLREKIGLSFSDRESLREALSYFVQHPKATRDMGERAKKILLEKYSLQAFSESLKNFYAQVLRNR